MDESRRNVFNLSKTGNIIGVIRDSEGKDLKMIYETPYNNTKDIKTYNVIKLKDNETIQQIPIGRMTNGKNQRFISLILGKSGIGKSTYANNLAIEYHSYYPKNSILLFTDNPSSELKVKGADVKRVIIDEENFINDPIGLEEISNSFCVFDDIDAMNDKILKEALFKFLNKVLQYGRHHNISLAITMHKLVNGKDSTIMLDEAHSITYFPQFVSPMASKYLLENYVGINQYQINYIRKSGAYWATLYKDGRIFCMTDKMLFDVNKLYNNSPYLEEYKLDNIKETKKIKKKYDKIYF